MLVTGGLKGVGWECVWVMRGNKKGGQEPSWNEPVVVLGDFE